MSISELQLHTLVFTGVAAKARCEACPHFGDCEVGEMHRQGKVPVELDVFQRRKVLLGNAELPALKCLG